RAFPLLAPSSGLDGLTAGLAHAVQDGSPGAQVAALALMIRRGEARAAADALRGKRLTPDGLAAVLGKLATQDGVAKADGLFALLTSLLCESERTAVPAVLRQLDHVAEQYPAGAAWRMAAVIRCGIDWTRLTALSAD